MDNPLQQVDEPPKGPRPLYVIAREIQQNWVPVNQHAVPYLNAMRQLRRMDEYYGADSATSVVIYFLSNSQGWRGPIARRIKTELRDQLDNYKTGH